MTEQSNAAATSAAVDPVVEPIYFDVKLNRKITIEDFTYLPSHHHVVDKAILDAMNAEGVVADVKQLS
jgi:hypothetical protein